MRDLNITFTVFNTVYTKRWDYDTPIGLIHEHLKEICPTYHISNIEFVNKDLNKKTIKPKTMYSQNNEEKFITEYFGEFKGTVLDIGANDGKTFSNSLKLIELGWRAVLVEPSPACLEKLRELHKESVNVIIVPAAVGTKTGEEIFNESGPLLVPELSEDNISLVSTLIPKEKERWTPLNMQWNEYPVKVFTYEDLNKEFSLPGKYDFVSIDAEGVDLEILKQIDLSGVKLLCVEYNLDQSVKREILEYTKRFGMEKIIYETGENLLICRE